MKSIYDAGGVDILAAVNVETGTDAADNMADTAANDSIDAGAGDDTIASSLGGSDSLLGGDGDDTITVTRSADHGKDAVIVDGGSGDDVISYAGNIANKDTVSIDGGAGADSVNVTDAFAATVNGGAGDDSITINHAIGALIDGGAGLNVFDVSGADQDTFVFGGRDVDTVTISSIGHAIVHTADGDDVINASSESSDARTGISSGEGVDTVNLDANNYGHYRMRLGDGQDVVNLSASTDVIGDPKLSTKLVMYDFQAGDGGDQLNLDPFLKSTLNHGLKHDPFADHHLQLVEGTTPGGEAATYLQMDFDGDKNGAVWTTLAVFVGVAADDLTSFNLGGLDPVVTASPDHDGLVI